MRILFFAMLILATAGVSSASNITVVTPANNSQVSSTFQLTARTTVCGGVPAVSMGYSIDSSAATIEATAFTAMVSASTGAHVLHVKCWGQQTHDEKLLSLDVVPHPVSATPQFSLPSGTYTSQQAVTIFEQTPGSVVYYTTDGSAPSPSSLHYSGSIPVKQTMVLQAMASASGYQNSGYARASYQLVQNSGPNVPPNAIQVTELQTLPDWRIKHDPATGGSATGAMSIVGDPSISGQAAGFDTTFTDYGGVLYSVTYGNDPAPENFLYDAQVWIDDGSIIGNLEMDNNQVIANGDTVIYAFQCAGDSNTWDYSENAGTAENPIVQWVHSTEPCNPATWTTNAWHHVQITYSRDDVGNVTYHSVWLDGVDSPINETVFSAFALSWASGDLITNFQVDGTGPSGASTLYLDQLTISRW